MNNTVLFILVIVFVVAIYDVFVIFKVGKYESISAHIIRISKEMPLVVLLLGIVLGHLFWSMDTFNYLEHNKLKDKCEIFLKEQGAK